MNVVPRRQGLAALVLSAAGQVSDVQGTALSSHLAERRVSERMASIVTSELGLRCATVDAESRVRHERRLRGQRFMPAHDEESIGGHPLGQP